MGEAGHLNVEEVINILNKIYGYTGEYSKGTRGSLHASQSLLAVGNSPMLQHLYMPSPMHANWQTINVTCCGSKAFGFPGVLNGANELEIVMIAFAGLVKSMPTTIILKICTPLPDM